jgi:hypothetical protein
VPLAPPPPVVLAYGIGVDSTALLIEKHARGEAPDLVLTADTSVEKPATYEYLDVIRPWMRDRGIRFELVSYVPKRFKHWPPYYGILEMCLTNATLPSKSLGGSSCSLKYKKAPQDKFLSTWQPAVDAWARGQRVVRLIGYDAGPRDTARANHTTASTPCANGDGTGPTASPASRPRVCRCHPNRRAGCASPTIRAKSAASRNGACDSSCWSRHAPPRDCTRSRACGADRPARARDR